MRLILDVSLQYTFPEPTTALLAIEAAHTDGQEIVTENIAIQDATVTRFIGDSGVGNRLWVDIPGAGLTLTYHAEVETPRANPPLDSLTAQPLNQIPAEAAPYLRPSRYVQSDKFVSFVAKKFGHLDGGAKAQAIVDWIGRELSYVPGSSIADTTVLDTFAGREGVCRDYAHLTCAMLRAANLPARMVAAYGPDVNPQDFHAVAQVWLDGGWHLVDATGMSTPETLAIVAVGRDAYDIAFMTSLAPATLVEQRVQVSRG
ncbi:transglutaminase family protein [Maritimibacter sp. DP1N21-5]|uniref:transglutaminase-like domain-containing protein n=1 Tax=Maritimibacter sp. DP1N21-5 TaxID=2836867 RepID=UPI001C47226A|nr:transglutaminase family protein [Maritimibacter sp. DP1N21-5]MBV7407783.1 transglutaminase family protein [Maritimibacter sp. DP1N21-5]